jgi:ABC-type transporter Mla subunit MlaD
MTLPRRTWWLSVAVLSAALSLATALTYHFSPTGTDFADPLGRLPTLARSVNGSTAIIDRLSAKILDEHRTINDQTKTGVELADNLDRLVAESGALGPLTTDANARTAHLTTGIAPLSALVATLTGHTGDATGVANRLDANVGTVAGQLGEIGRRLAVINTHLDPLAPQAHKIASVLGQLEREASRLRPVGPILGRLSR